MCIADFPDEEKDGLVDNKASVVNLLYILKLSILGCIFKSNVNGCILTALIIC